MDGEILRGSLESKTRQCWEAVCRNAKTKENGKQAFSVLGRGEQASQPPLLGAGRRFLKLWMISLSRIRKN